jgi:hypothetical protein
MTATPPLLARHHLSCHRFGAEATTAAPASATRPREEGVWSGIDEGPKAPADPFQAIPGARDDPPPF